MGFWHAQRWKIRQKQRVLTFFLMQCCWQTMNHSFFKRLWINIINYPIGKYHWGTETLRHWGSKAPRPWGVHLRYFKKQSIWNVEIRSNQCAEICFCGRSYGNTSQWGKRQLLSADAHHTLPAFNIFADRSYRNTYCWIQKSQNW